MNKENKEEHKGEYSALVLSDEEQKRLAVLGELITKSLACNINDSKCIPCRTDRLEAVKLMKEYVKINEVVKCIGKIKGELNMCNACGEGKIVKDKESNGCYFCDSCGMEFYFDSCGVFMPLIDNSLKEIKKG